VSPERVQQRPEGRGKGLKGKKKKQNKKKKITTQKSHKTSQAAKSHEPLHGCSDRPDPERQWTKQAAERAGGVLTNWMAEATRPKGS